MIGRYGDRLKMSDIRSFFGGESPFDACLSRFKSLCAFSVRPAQSADPAVPASAVPALDEGPTHQEQGDEGDEGDEGQR